MYSTVVHLVSPSLFLRTRKRSMTDMINMLSVPLRTRPSPGISWSYQVPMALWQYNVLILVLYVQCFSLAMSLRLYDYLYTDTPRSHTHRLITRDKSHSRIHEPATTFGNIVCTVRSSSLIPVSNEALRPSDHMGVGRSLVFFPL
jgi:hypothetical protein